jgi:hypothetical protein
MSKEYLVTAYEIMRTVYVVKANTPEEAKAKLETNDHSYEVASEEYHDRDRIDDEVEENI